MSKPVIDFGDITTSEGTSVGGLLNTVFPDYVSGDLLIMFLGMDDDFTANDLQTPSAGPNGEPLIVDSTGSGGNATSGPTQGVIAWVGDATVSSDTIPFTATGSEFWVGRCIKVLAGEFDPITPIGALSGYAGNTAADGSTVATPSWALDASDGGGAIVVHMVVDVDPITGNPSGWTLTTNIDHGGLATAITQRDAESVDSETVASVDYTVDSDSSSTVGLVVRPAPTANITSVDSDYGAASDEFDVDEDSLDVNGVLFEPTQGSGTVWLADEETLLASDAEVDLAAAINTWGNTEVNLDLTDLSAGDQADIEALIVSDGNELFIILVNDTGDEAFLPVTVHRAKAFAMSLSANIAASGEDTTAQLTAPASGSFGGGRIQDDENPADTVDIGGDEYFEDEWCIEALPNSVYDETYLFRVLVGAIPAGTITVTPGLTVEVAAGETAALTGVEATPAVGTVDVEHDQALSGVEATPEVGSVTPSTTVDLSGVESVTAVGNVGVEKDGQVDLSGVESPTAVGSVTPSTTIELSGVEATPQVGSVTPSTRVDLSGVESVTAVGDVAEEHDGSVELTGVEATTAVGNVGVEESGQVDLAGVESPSAVGSVGVEHDQALAGVEATPEVGSVGVDNVQDLAGVEATPAVGAVTPSTTVELSGVESVTAVGDVVAVIDAVVVLTGVESPSAVDSVGVEHDQALSGVEATPEVGSVTPSTTVEISGVETVSAVGSVTEDHPSTVELSGVEAVTAVGNIGVEESGEVALAGVEATPQVGFVGVINDQTLSGVEATPAVGSVTPSTTVELSGVESVTAVGDVDTDVDVDRALTGVESPSAVGSVGVLHDQDLSGVEATPEVGSVTPSTTVQLSGVEATPEVGSVGFTESGTVELSGVEAVSAVGNVGVEESGEVALAGVEATTAVDSVGVVHDQDLSGVEILPQVGSVAPSTTIELSGVEATPEVGTLFVAAAALGDVYNAAAFFPTGSTVTIELWDPITGMPISLSNAGCNEVPGEGVFVWDSTKLTTQPTASYQEFLWKMTDGITEAAGVIRMSITVEDIFDRVGENGETFGESLVLIRANAAGSIEQDAAGSYKIKSADGLTDRIEGDPAPNDGRDVTATDAT